MIEKQNVEWKTSWRDEYLKWICGFANAEGGALFIGMDDAGKAVGVPDARKLLEDLPNKVRDVLGIMVNVRLLKKSGREVIEIKVDPYPSPVSYKGEYHYRSGSTKQQLKGAALERFLLRKRGRHWDDAPVPSFTARTCSSAALKLFKKHAAQSGRMDPGVLKDSTGAVLENLELTESTGLKRAACLLFSDNAVVHKDYGSHVPIQISVYDDKIIFWNSGVLPENWTLRKLLGKHPSQPFNPLVAHAFFRAGFIESWGRGIEKIKNACKEHGVSAPKYDPDMAGLMVTFRADAGQVQQAGQSSGNTAPATTQEIIQETTQEKIISQIRRDPSVTRRRLAERLGLSENGVKYHLAKLRRTGIIRHGGATKAGYWEILGEDAQHD